MARAMVRGRGRRLVIRSWSLFKRSLALALIFVFLVLFYVRQIALNRLVGYHIPVQESRAAVNLVVASVEAEDTSWVNLHFTEYNSTIYVADNLAAAHTVPRDKGREANTFLTYIIDHYDHLPEFVIFLHGKRFQWHNEDPLYDSVAVVKQLQLHYVRQHGFATLRCTWDFGCDSELKPTEEAPNAAIDGIADGPGTDDRRASRSQAETIYPRAFRDLFGSQMPVPDRVAVHRGSQFAVTREAIHSRSRDDYIHFRDWIWTSGLNDDLSSKILEYSWHIMFGKDSVLCPDAATCFCDKFGLCGLKNCRPGSCEKRYWAHSGPLPRGWPDAGAGRDGWPDKDWAE